MTLNCQYNTLDIRTPKSFVLLASGFVVSLQLSIQHVVPWSEVALLYCIATFLMMQYNTTATDLQHVKATNLTKPVLRGLMDLGINNTRV
jgi:hypothetical protein